MRIVGGAWRGRRLAAPADGGTRPTSDRARQALFDMLMHAPWAGRAVIEDAHVLDAFAGTGALGLEALSRGAARATFFEQDRAALRVLRANVAACGAEACCTVREGDALLPPRAAGDAGCGVVFLDPPYGLGLVPLAVAALGAKGWMLPEALVVAEMGRAEAAPADGSLLAERVYGAARICVWRMGGQRERRCR
ncbi:MAG TPA: 16S rRNA (guanine(966)-N(2))-methyltransferase RsmD [Acetobacteraceae bacterium]